MKLTDNINGKIVKAEIQANGFIFFSSNDLPIQKRYVLEYDGIFRFYAIGLLYDLRYYDESEYQNYINENYGMIQVENIEDYMITVEEKDEVKIYKYPTKCELDRGLEKFKNKNIIDIKRNIKGLFLVKYINFLKSKGKSYDYITGFKNGFTDVFMLSEDDFFNWDLTYQYIEGYKKGYNSSYKDLYDLMKEIEND